LPSGFDENSFDAFQTCGPGMRFAVVPVQVSALPVLCIVNVICRDTGDSIMTLLFGQGGVTWFATLNTSIFQSDARLSPLLDLLNADSMNEQDYSTRLQLLSSLFRDWHHPIVDIIANTDVRMESRVRAVDACISTMKYQGRIHILYSLLLEHYSSATPPFLIFVPHKHPAEQIDIYNFNI
jgi:hypothetical protein